MKKSFRKAAAFMLTAALLTGALAGCSGGSQQPQPQQSAAGTSAKQAGGNKVLRVGMECNYAPYNWSQADDSNGAVKVSNSNEYTNGYDVLMAKKVASAAGYDLQIVKTKWEGLPTGVISGKLDAVIDGMSATADRKQTLDFSDNYYKATIFALVKQNGKYAKAKSIADLKGCVCTSQQSTVWYDLLKQIPQAKVLPALSDVPSMVVSLESGKCEALLCDKPTALAATYSNKDLLKIDLENDTTLKVPEDEMDIAIAVKKGNTELKDAINKALAGISQADRDKMMDEAIKDQPLAK